MRRAARAAVLGLALAASALAACAGSSSASSTGSGGFGGSTGNGGAGAAEGGAGGQIMCTVAIVPISPASFDGLAPGPNTTLRVQGLASGPLPAAFTWDWRVTSADGNDVPFTLPMPADRSLMEFPLASPGSYTVDVALDSTGGPPCSGVRTVTAAQAGGVLATFRFRITPPAGATVPAQELQRQVTGGTPSGGNVLALQPGIQVPLDVRRAATSAPLPAYVRLTDATTGAVVEARTSAAGPASVRVAGGSYSMLIVPDGTAVAPALFDATATAALPAGAIMLDDGIAVGGTVKDAGGNPLAGATVVLRAGALVSTVARSDTSGTFSAQVRPGTFGVTLSAPLPSAATLEADLSSSAASIVIANGTAPPQLALKLGASAVASAHATVALHASNPASLGLGTRVTLEEAVPLAGAASLDMGGGGPALLMSARVRGELGPATSGMGAVTVDLGTLPPAPYRLTVYPADGSTSDAVTMTPVDLSGGSLASAQVSLAGKVAVRGKLLPPTLLSANLVAGVEMLATDTQGLPIVGSQAAAADGTFAILVSPLRTYALQALPAPGQPLARALFPVVSVANVDVDVPDQDMPPGLLFTGTVVDSGPAPVASARVQVFCVAGASGCTDATVPLAETVTRSDGSFQLVLPDPGTTGP
jgi:hypothetical protein